MIRIGLDTNVLAYLAGVERGPADSGKIDRAREVVARLQVASRFVAPAQTLGELFNVLIRTGLSRAEAKPIVVRFLDTFETADGGAATMMAAVDLAVAAGLQIWDALIMSVAIDAGCVMLLTEDMREGFVWRGLTLINPFTDTPHPRLAALLG